MLNFIDINGHYFFSALLIYSSKVPKTLNQIRRYPNYSINCVKKMTTLLYTQRIVKDFSIVPKAVNGFRRVGPSAKRL